MKLRVFRDIPLRRKLTLVIMLTSTVALLTSTLAVVGYEIVRLRRTMTRDVSAEAAMIADNSTAALSFGDAKGAQGILASLRNIPEIVFACIYEPDGRVFARYIRGDDQNISIPPLSQFEGSRFEANYLNVSRRVELGNEVIGSVYLRADLREEAVRIRAFGIIVISMTIASLLVALILSMRLQQFVSEPILTLSDMTRQIGIHQDYSLRAVKHGDDEIGVLTDGLNQMLAQLQIRDEDLRASEERFRQVTESIREVFWMSDIEKNQIVYVSPGYELIWGRSVASLYDNAHDWIDAIHVDDRERIRRAALTKQAGGEYDEEYRIVRPDGDIHWIRDRAFPVRDADGNVYRIAGIAEDITERKRLEKDVLEISDRERARLGQDMHDDLCQQLISIAFASNMLTQKLRKESIPEAAASDEIACLLDGAITRARALARALFPVTLETEGLVVALQDLTATVGGRFQIECRLDCEEPVVVEDLAAATHLYRIAQEAITNAIRHAKASRIIVRLESADREIRLRVADDGIGIQDQKNGKRGMGLQTMYSRASLIGGSLQIERKESGGTEVVCRMRLKQP
jgi:PAS domain S-box-containing protein